MTISATLPAPVIGQCTPAGRLSARDVLRLWNAEQERLGRPPVTLRAVHVNIARSQPAEPGRPANPYQHNPMPLPRYPHPDRPRKGQKPFWEPEPGETLDALERQLRAWWVGRPGRSGNGGGRDRGGPRRRRCGCGSGALVPKDGACVECTYNLTRRERRLAGEVVAGGTNEEIAGRLGVARSTVRSQLKAVYRKVGVHDRHELVMRLVTEPAGG